MVVRSRRSYQDGGGLEKAVLDLVAAGVQGQPAATRQVALRITKGIPASVQDPDRFKAMIHDAMAVAPGGPRGANPVRLQTPPAPSSEFVDVDDDPRGHGLVLPTAAAIELDEIIHEHAMRDALAAHGLEPTRSLLLHGAPGVGKTMTAAWLAQQMGLSLVTLNLAAVVSSLLGTTGRNLKAALDFAAQEPVVLLIDEFDAVAKHRDDLTDIGELKRIVNVLLLELDRWPSSSVLVAATNHPQLLDVAIERRFDRSIELDRPDLAARLLILRHLLGHPDQIDVRVEAIAEATADWTGSDLHRLHQKAARRAALRESDVVDETISETISDLPSGPSRDRVWLHLADRLGLPARQIAEMSGVTHPTVGAGVRRARRGQQ